MVWGFDGFPVCEADFVVVVQFRPDHELFLEEGILARLLPLDEEAFAFD